MKEGENEKKNYIVGFDNTLLGIHLMVNMCGG